MNKYLCLAVMGLILAGPAYAATTSPATSGGLTQQQLIDAGAHLDPGCSCFHYNGQTYTLQPNGTYMPGATDAVLPPNPTGCTEPGTDPTKPCPHEPGTRPVTESKGQDIHDGKTDYRLTCPVLKKDGFSAENCRKITDPAHPNN
jgi:hypothetical protein